MWSRWEIKERAKAVLRTSYWKAFLVSLILGVTAGNHGISTRFNEADADHIFQGSVDHIFRGSEIWLPLPFETFLFGALTLITISLAAILIAVMLLSPLEVGAQYYFLESTQMRFRLENVARGFTGGGYGNVVMTMLLRYIYTLLWYLLLVIPGIIKTYSYFMVPYLLAENPRIPPNRAIDMSRQIMAGHKWQMFVLDLSFLGWYLLGALAFGIGILFVLPYHNTAHAQLYVTLRTIALDRQIISLQELEGY